jgi:RNA polymerase sigma factor (sigma-70 family)
LEYAATTSNSPAARHDKLYEAGLATLFLFACSGVSIRAVEGCGTKRWHNRPSLRGSVCFGLDWPILCTKHHSHAARAATLTWVPEDAEDVVQQTFQQAFIHLHKFQGKSSFCTWLTRIAMNEALMLLRNDRARREVSIDNSSEDEATSHGLEIPDSGPDPEANYLNREETEALAAATNKLSAQRSSYGNSLSYQAGRRRDAWASLWVLLKHGYSTAEGTYETHCAVRGSLQKPFAD